jgi:hypothetical protein
MENRLEDIVESLMDIRVKGDAANVHKIMGRKPDQKTQTSQVWYSGKMALTVDKKDLGHFKVTNPKPALLKALSMPSSARMVRLPIEMLNVRGTKATVRSLFGN